MDPELKEIEIEKCKELLKNPSLGYNQRLSIESYLRSLGSLDLE